MSLNDKSESLLFSLLLCFFFFIAFFLGLNIKMRMETKFERFIVCF